MEASWPEDKEPEPPDTSSSLRYDDFYFQYLDDTDEQLMRTFPYYNARRFNGGLRIDEYLFYDVDGSGLVDED